MKHYAKVVGDKVVKVIVAEAEFFSTFIDDSPGLWLECSATTYGNQNPEGEPLRANFPGIGYTYDRIKDVFYEPQPFVGWVLSDTTYLWEPPVPMPTDGQTYFWSNEQQNWLISQE